MVLCKTRQVCDPKKMRIFAKNSVRESNVMTIKNCSALLLSLLLLAACGEKKNTPIQIR